MNGSYVVIDTMMCSCHHCLKNAQFADKETVQFDVLMCLSLGVGGGGNCAL